MASLGHRVVGFDIDEEKIAMLASGKPPFYEPGFADLLAEQVSGGGLLFTSDPRAIARAQIHFISVGTPQLRGRYAADLRQLSSAIDMVIAQLPRSIDPVLIAGKSTVPVGTAAKIAMRIASSQKNAIVAWNPEFLREGFAIDDTLRPDRIVYGLPAQSPAANHAQDLLDTCYRPLLEAGIPRILTDYATAELVKVAANSFLATKISFINAMAELCDASGADVTQLAEAIGYDERIGSQFLRAGIGFGGGCLPKDIRAFMARAGELGVDEALTFLREVDAINLRQRQKTVELARELLNGSLSGKRVAVLGAAFKPNSDDLRDSPALDIAQQISGRGATVTITDPAAAELVAAKRPNLRVASSVEDACRDADIVLLLTEWDEYRQIDPTWLATVVAQPIIIDGRNILDPKSWVKAGWYYRGIGRCCNTAHESFM